MASETGVESGTVNTGDDITSTALPGVSSVPSKVWQNSRTTSRSVMTPHRDSSSVTRTHEIRFSSMTVATSTSADSGRTVVSARVMMSPMLIPSISSSPDHVVPVESRHIRGSD